MASNRSGAQKLVRVFSIIALILGIAVLALGLIGFFGAGAIVAETGGEAVETVGEISGTTSQFMKFGSLLFILASAFTILEGVFGIRASNDNTKAMPYIIFAALSLAMNVYNMVTAGFDVSYIFSLAISVACLWAGFQIRSESQN